MGENYYPLAVVASELDCGIRELERRCNGGVVRNEDSMRCIPGSLVRELIAEHDAKLEFQAQQKAAHRADAEKQRAKREAERQAMQARRERQRGLVVQGLDAHQVVLLDTGEDERRSDLSPLGDYISGNLQYRPISERG